MTLNTFCCGPHISEITHLNLGENWISRNTFSTLKCPETKCFITNKRNFFFETTLFDALIFHERNLNPNDLPDKRLDQQLYVHFNLESPVWSPLRGSTIYDSFFNLSMSYREDSDIRLPYGRFVKKNATQDYSGENLMLTVQNYGKKKSTYCKKVTK